MRDAPGSSFGRLFRRRRKWNDRATRNDVRYAYRFILRRPADPEGLAYYFDRVADGISFDDLVRSFTGSAEARERLDAESRPRPVDLGGYTVCVQRRDTDFAQGILATHDYEPHVRRAVRERLRDGDVMVDVGANVGCITLMAAGLVGQRGRVAAVEPNPDNLQMLYAGMVLNGFGNVRVFPYAASDRPGVVSLTGGTSNTNVVSAQDPERLSVYAQAVALDDVLASLPRLDLVKMDVEGHEPKAFEGFSRAIERYRPALVVEFNPRCLVDLEHYDPAAFLDRILAVYPCVRAISPFGDDQWFARPGDLIDYWERRNREVTAAGLLPDRLLHFDLIVERGRPR